MDMRVEDLAARTKVSVDTVRYYQKEGLLPPPHREGRIAWYRDEHVDRIGRIRELQRRGFTLAVIKRFLSGELNEVDEPLVRAIVDVGRGDGEEFLTLDELAERAGVPAPLIDAVVKEGLLVPRLHNGERAYTTADLDALRAGLSLIEVGVPLPELFELARHHNAATREIAEAAVGLFHDHVREPLRSSGIDPAERADRLVEAFRVALPAVSTLVAHHFTRTLLLVAQEHLEKVGEQEEIQAAADEARRNLAIVRSS